APGAPPNPGTRRRRATRARPAVPRLPTRRARRRACAMRSYRGLRAVSPRLAQGRCNEPRGLRGAVAIEIPSSPPLLRARGVDRCRECVRGDGPLLHDDGEIEVVQPRRARGLLRLAFFGERN